MGSFRYNEEAVWWIWIFSGFFSGKDKKDKTSEAMAKIMDQEMKDKEKHMQDELDAEEKESKNMIQAQIQLEKQKQSVWRQKEKTWMHN